MATTPNTTTTTPPSTPVIQLPLNIDYMNDSWCELQYKSGCSSTGSISHLNQSVNPEILEKLLQEAQREAIQAQNGEHSPRQRCLPELPARTASPATSPNSSATSTRSIISEILASPSSLSASAAAAAVAAAAASVAASSSSAPNGVNLLLAGQINSSHHHHHHHSLSVSLSSPQLAAQARSSTFSSAATVAVEQLKTSTSTLRSKPTGRVNKNNHSNNHSNNNSNNKSSSNNSSISTAVAALAATVTISNVSQSSSMSFVMPSELNTSVSASANSSKSSSNALVTFSDSGSEVSGVHVHTNKYDLEDLEFEEDLDADDDNDNDVDLEYVDEDDSDNDDQVDNQTKPSHRETTGTMSELKRRIAATTSSSSPKSLRTNVGNPASVAVAVAATADISPCQHCVKHQQQIEMLVERQIFHEKQLIRVRRDYEEKLLTKSIELTSSLTSSSSLSSSTLSTNGVKESVNVNVNLAVASSNQRGAVSESPQALNANADWSRYWSSRPQMQPPKEWNFVHPNSGKTMQLSSMRHDTEAAESTECRIDLTQSALNAKLLAPGGHLGKIIFTHMASFIVGATLMFLILRRHVNVRSSIYFI